MIELQGVSKSFDGVKVIDDLSLNVAQGEFMVILGSSGSGKSTLLKMMNRLVDHDSGRVLFAGKEIRSFRPEDIRRRMGYAIQSIGLFPHWSVKKNIATVPALLKWPKARIEARVSELLTLLQLEPETYQARYPHQLSGGQQQRVGVARALAGNPEVLLMDEPFGALDPVTRAALQLEIARIHKAFNKTIVLVTHDIDEALSLATRIVLLDQGRIVQSGTPLQILSAPANDFVLDFFGRGDVGIKLLGLQRVGDHLRANVQDLPDDAGSGEAILATLSLREALSIFVSRRVSRLSVIDSQGQHMGSIELQDLLGPTGPATRHPRDNP
ncbi:ABC transporter ATP-binding protein [Polaromonas sp.]|uniref:ABC transporter ATP-binding protein n=1 Tax=Polaromonas sp. TaxID=1869339 RepID=UPI0017A66DAF|nr:ABC transporter ATP-binding protein [Polaromonas sp.]NML84540.1 ABC transporter ATP-binding protein [Polaromonas sp.]